MNKRILHIIISYIAFAGVLNAQQYVLLLQYTGNDLIKLDSVPMIENGTITFPSVSQLGSTPPQPIKGSHALGVDNISGGRKATIKPEMQADSPLELRADSLLGVRGKNSNANPAASGENSNSKDNAFEPGVYEIAIGKDTKAFVIDDKQKNVKFKIKNGKLTALRNPPLAGDKGGGKATAYTLFPTPGNKAFDAMNKMIGEWNGLNKKYNEFVMLNRRSGKSRTEIDSIDKLLLTESFLRFGQHYSSLDSLAMVYPDSYVAKVLIPIYKKPVQKGWIKYPQELWQYAEHYFDNWDYSQPGFFNNPLIKARLMEFIRSYNPVNYADAHIKTVDKIMDKAEYNDDAKAWMLDFLLELYLKMGPEEVVYYLYNNYIEGCGEDKVQRHLIKRVLQLKNLKSGVEAREFELTDYYGKKYNNKNFKKRDRGVIYVFWSSTCGHCQEEMPVYLPKLVEMYSEGFEIVSVSTDREESNYKEFIKNNNLKMEGVTHIFEGKGLEGVLPSTYFVYGTPSVYVIDKENKFVKRVSGLRRLFSD